MTELYSAALEANLIKNSMHGVTFIATQYARYMSKTDSTKALAVFTKALSSEACVCKVLYLQYINLARSSKPDSYALVKSIFDQAMATVYKLEEGSEKYKDMIDLCEYYLQFLEEEAPDAE